jgi:integrase
MAIVSRKFKSGLRYQVKVRDANGRWFKSPSFDRRVDAERFERQLLTKRDAGELARSKVVRDMTFSAYWSQWSETRRRNITEGWRQSQSQMARAYLLPRLGNRKLSEIRAADIGDVVGRVLDSGRGQQTALHVYNLLHKMFSDAVEYDGIIERSPVMRRDRPEVHVIERHFLKPDDSWRLLAHSRAHYLGPAIWLGLLSGLRPEAVIALRFDAVDFKRQEITIRAGYKKKIRSIEPYPKGKKWKVVPMPDMLAQYLVEVRTGRTDDDFVAQSSRGGMLSHEALLRGLKEVCKAADVPIVTPHELRHSCTELYVAQGASEEDLRRLLTHDSLTAVKRYLHPTSERLRAIAARVAPTPSQSNVIPVAFGPSCSRNVPVAENLGKKLGS